VRVAERKKEADGRRLRNFAKITPGTAKEELSFCPCVLLAMVLSRQGGDNEIWDVVIVET
jgi:hypothetical protein